MTRRVLYGCSDDDENYCDTTFDNIITLLETFDQSRKIKGLWAHNFGNLIRVYYMVSNHPPPPSVSHRRAAAPPWTIHPYTGKGALTFRHFRPLVPQSRVTSIPFL